MTQLPRTAEDAEIRDLDRCGVRAVRFNLRRGGSEGIEALEEMAERVHALVGWHAEFYADARELGDLVPRLRALPQIVIDHLGLSAEGLPTVLELVAAGAKVKATGFGRIAFDVPAALQLRTPTRTRSSLAPICPRRARRVRSPRQTSRLWSMRSARSGRGSRYTTTRWPFTGRGRRPVAPPFDTWNHQRRRLTTRSTGPPSFPRIS